MGYDSLRIGIKNVNLIVIKYRYRGTGNSGSRKKFATRYERYILKGAGRSRVTKLCIDKNGGLFRI